MSQLLHLDKLHKNLIIFLRGYCDPRPLHIFNYGVRSFDVSSVALVCDLTDEELLLIMNLMKRKWPYVIHNENDSYEYSNAVKQEIYTYHNPKKNPNPSTIQINKDGEAKYYLLSEIEIPVFDTIDKFLEKFNLKPNKKLKDCDGCGRVQSCPKCLDYCSDCARRLLF